MSKPNEKDLLRAFKLAKEKKDKADAALDEAKNEFDKAEFCLIEFLENESATATATYDGLGRAQMNKPKLYASCKNENQDDLFKFLEEQGREDLIKTAVPAPSLSSFVKECIEEGIEFPKFINYYLKTSLKLV